MNYKLLQDNMFVAMAKGRFPKYLHTLTPSEQQATFDILRYWLLKWGVRE